MRFSSESKAESCLIKHCYGQNYPLIATTCPEVASRFVTSNDKLLWQNQTMHDDHCMAEERQIGIFCVYLELHCVNMVPLAHNKEELEHWAFFENKHNVIVFKEASIALPDPNPFGCSLVCV